MLQDTLRAPPPPHPPTHLVAASCQFSQCTINVRHKSPRIMWNASPRSVCARRWFHARICRRAAMLSELPPGVFIEGRRKCWKLQQLAFSADIFEVSPVLVLHNQKGLKKKKVFSAVHRDCGLLTKAWQEALHHRHSLIFQLIEFSNKPFKILHACVSQWVQ